MSFSLVKALPKKAEYPGLIIREKEPVNLEFPFPTLYSRITPSDSFFVRCHFPIPVIDAKDWSLTLIGEFQKPCTFSFEELVSFPSRTLIATLECAGNGRSALVPKAKGLLWDQGAVGTAEWTGVPLRYLLEKAGMKASALEIILEGHDKGSIYEEPKSPGQISFNHSLPVKKALDPDVLIAYMMNGELLRPAHGFPVRAVVPGWYGMASVKWLEKITAVSTPYTSYWQSMEYAYWKNISGKPSLVPVSAMLVKSEIARPALHEVIEGGTLYKVFGAAWAGEHKVEKVEFSADNGISWKPVILIEEAVPYTWILWEYEWAVPDESGMFQLMSRATDDLGHSQPPDHDYFKRTYMINSISKMEVFVR